VLPTRGLLLDLGCGRGLLLSALRGAGSGLRLIGIEAAKTAEVAARALAGEAEIVRGDLREAPLPACDAAALLDVLHYLERGEQERLLRAVAAALRPGGVLLLREADAGAGRGFAVVRLAERLASCARGEPFRRLVYRGAAEWERALAETGLRVESMPMGSGTPFANVLLVGRKP
jgi:Cyclopropane fatty acid synthase and related methyltransferases